jgi:hypothetical protein
MGRIIERAPEDDIAALDVGLDIHAAGFLERQPEILHWHDAAANDVDAAKERDICLHTRTF